MFVLEYAVVCKHLGLYVSAVCVCVCNLTVLLAGTVGVCVLLQPGNLGHWSILET